MNPRAFSDNPQMIPFLYVLNQLLLKTSAVKAVNPLQFLITNDTLHLIPYDRACLFDLEITDPKLVSISGQSQVSDTAPLVLQLQEIVKAMQQSEGPTVLSEANLPADKRHLWEELQKENRTSVYWLPIYYDKERVLGLWLEQWGNASFKLPVEGLEPLIKDFLLPAYGISWMRVSNRLSFKRVVTKNPKRASILAIAALAFLLFVRIPLRIVAPCAIVSSDPYPIRAPLDGIVDEIVVKPGQWINKDDLLVRYQAQVQEQALSSAQKQLLAKQLEMQRAAVLGWKDEELQNQLGILKAQKQKEEANLTLLKYEASLLSVKSPAAGIAVIDSPDEWRGRPVKIGDKILTVSDPNHTKVKIWIPESDNVPLDPDKDIRVFLNIAPSHSYAARIEYIGNEATVNEQEIPSFVAKADWVDGQPADAKLGLKGSAVLYGESVSLIYYIVRRPWYALRNLIGL